MSTETQPIVDSVLLSRVRSASGFLVQPEAIELVLEQSLKILKDETAAGKAASFEHIIGGQIQALRAQAQSEGRAADFDLWCLERKAKNGDNLLAKFFGRRAKVQTDLDDLKDFYESAMSLRSQLQSATVKRQQLTEQIGQAESDLTNSHGDERLAQSATEAAAAYGLRHKSEQSAAVFNDRLAHLVEAPAIRRILTERLVFLKDALTTQEASIKSLQAQLDAMEA
jgi:hypothetical protein